MCSEYLDIENNLGYYKLDKRKCGVVSKIGRA